MLLALANELEHRSSDAERRALVDAGLAMARRLGDPRLVRDACQIAFVTLWEAPSGRFLTTLGAHEGQAWGIAFSRDGRLLASGAVDGAVMLWDVEARRLVSRLTGHEGPVDNVAVSPDASVIL